ncbi:MAG: hypothetical protein KA104_00255 [Candidatus Pacebacteria bacterium]|nr:hypothetical protein [Candidatus Paceibacterota bacterium]
MTDIVSTPVQARGRPLLFHALLYGAALAIVYLFLATRLEPLPTSVSLDENSGLYMAGFLVVFVAATLAWRFPKIATLCLVGSMMGAPMSAQAGVPGTGSSLLGIGFMSLLVFIPFFLFTLPDLLKAIDEAGSKNRGAQSQG